MIDLDTLIKKHADETIEFQLRSHWIMFAGELVLVFVMALIPIAVGIFFNLVWPNLFVGGISRPLLVLAASAYYLMMWAFFITKFVDYYLDVYLVTTHRVLDVQQNGMFSRTVAELDLARVQDVTSEVKGIFHSLLDFGDVKIQTAGAEDHFVFENVKHPDQIRKRLLELVDIDRRNEGEAIISGSIH
jgi:membrane protein YdbS with pleckstrin-like domain